MVSYFTYLNHHSHLKEQVRYRADPVPYTGQNTYHAYWYHSYERRPRGWKQNKILHTDPEYKQFARGSFKEKYGDDFDTSWRDTQRCWKEYRRHQYHE